MPLMKTALIGSLLTMMFTLAPGPAHAGTNPPSASDPALDPLSREAGRFLDADLTALRRAAEAAYSAGDMKGAAGAYLNLLQHDIQDTEALYNLACCYGRMGDASKAARFLLKAVEAGFEDLGLVRKDPDFIAVRGKPAFDLAVDAVGERIKAREQRWGESVLVGVPVPLACRVRVPAHREKSGAPPLLVALHGFASRPESLTPLWDALDHPAFIFAAPQGPFPLPGRIRPAFSWRAPLPDDTREGNGRALEMTDRTLVALIGELKQRYGAGEVYLMGFSQGAYFAYATGLRHPDLLAGLLCFGGKFPQDLLDGSALDGAKGLRIFIAHGTRDAVVPPAEGEKAQGLFREHGFDVTMVRFDGGHEVPDAVFRQAAGWLDPISRGNSAPNGLQY